MNRPILTIAIPTYSRVDKLRICLERVIEEVEDVIYDVEVLVSDNASTDGTEAFMRQLILDNSQIEYYRNIENIGPDRNFLNCYEKARGEYVLLLGDDDMLLPGSIKRILASIEKKPVAIFLNSSGLVSTDPLRNSAPRFEEKGDILLASRDEALSEIGIYITFVSSFVLQTDLVRRVPNKEQYIGSYFIQSHIALATMKTPGNYIMNSYNCLAASGNETVSYDLYYVWFESYHKLFTTTAVESGFSEDTMKRVYTQSLNTTVKAFVSYFRRTCKNQKDWDKSCVYNNLEGTKKEIAEIKFLVDCPLLLLRIYCFVQRFFGGVFRRLRKLAKKIEI